MIVVDASALIAILWREPEEQAFLRLCLEGDALLSSATRLEAWTVCLRRRSPANASRMERLIGDLQLISVDFDADQLAIARDAYARYGRAGEKPALNFGDCFAYALAKSRNLPLLFKGADFASTDIRAA